MIKGAGRREEDCSELWMVEDQADVGDGMGRFGYNFDERDPSEYAACRLFA